jgi:hypothetical protein
MPSGLVRHVHDDRRCLAQPAPGRRARDAKRRGDGHIPAVVDEIPKPVIVTLRNAACGRHANDHRSFADAAQPSGHRSTDRDDNSRVKVQNVRVDSSAGCQRSHPRGANSSLTVYSTSLAAWVS